MPLEDPINMLESYTNNGDVYFIKVLENYEACFHILKHSLQPEAIQKMPAVDRCGSSIRTLTREGPTERSEAKQFFC